MNKLEMGIVAFAVIGTIGLAFLAQLSAPADASIAALPSLEGRSVALECVVCEMRKFDSGSAILTVRDPENASLRAPVVIETCASDFHFGDLIRVYGKAVKYEGNLEIIALSDRSVLVLLRANQSTKSLSVHELADNPGAYLGMTINISGTVADVRSASFDLKSGGCIITVRTTDPEYLPEKGADIWVCGQVMFDKENFRYYIGVSGVVID